MGSSRLSTKLPEELAEIVAARVASGRNVSAGEVIQETLELFTRENEPLDEWQERELPAAYEEWKTADSARPSPPTA